MHMKNGRTKKSFVSFAALALIAFSAIVLSACTTATPSDTWVLPNQNVKNTRYAGGRINSNTIQNLGVAWTSSIKAQGGFGASAPTPIITMDTVYVAAATGKVAALDFFTGQPAVAKTIALNSNGRPAWLNANVFRKSTTLGLKISPILTNTNVSEPNEGTPIVVVADPKGTIYALNSKNSNNEWKRTIEPVSGTTPRVESNMAVAGGNVFVPVVNVPTSSSTGTPGSIFNTISRLKNSSGSLVSLNSENGKVNWTKKLASAPLGGVAVANNIAFVTTVNGNIYAFDSGSGDQLWTSKLPAGSVAPVAVSDDTVIVPASLVTRPGQRAQVVAFRIGGLGKVGGAAPPKVVVVKSGPRAKATAPGATTTPAAAGPDGKTIFTANCAGCHVLKAAGSSGNVGPNLDSLKPADAVVVKQVINGGGPMPAFKGTLSPAEIKAVAAFVSSNAGK
jgi:outer membrane protein assembly factor BamB